MSSGYYRMGQRRVDVDGNDPSAFGICDRCGFLVNLRHLRWQMQWNAQTLFNTRMLICSRCWDRPQEQLKQIVLPTDPIGLPNARPEFYDSLPNNPINEDEET